MAKSGRRGLPPHIKRQRGETRPSRQTVLLFPGVDPSTVAGTPPPAPPAGMSPAARRIWIAKAQRYHARGIRIADYIDTLQAFCELEAALTAAWRSKQGPTMAMVNAHRLFSHEFFETPATAQITARSLSRDGSGGGNRFRMNGRPPADVGPPPLPPDGAA